MDKELLIKTRKSIKIGDFELFTRLIENNEGLIDAITPFGTWLHVASAHGQLDIVKYLVDKGMDVNTIEGLAKSGAIREASFNGHINIVQYLYEHGAELDTSEATKNPLFAAIYDGHFDIVEYLVEQGIDIAVEYPIGKLENVDAYEYARQFGKTEIKEYLQEKLGKK